MNVTWNVRTFFQEEHFYEWNQKTDNSYTKQCQQNMHTHTHTYIYSGMDNVIAYKTYANVLTSISL